MDTKAFNEKNFDKSRTVCEGIEREDGGDYKTEANNLRYQLNASERKSERRLRQIDYLESVIRNRNAELKERKQLVHELRNEVRKLGKQVSDLSAERENGGNCVVLTDRERVILGIWPKFEDGEYVWFGDETDRIVGKVIAIQFGAALVSFWNDSDDRVYMNYGERVMRPTPKVLDADGVEIKVGDTVYAPRMYGDTSFTVSRFTKNCDGDTLVMVEEMGSGLFPSCLTHTRPDSWGRLEMDAELNDETGIVGGNLDIVRRAKALAGVGE